MTLRALQRDARRISRQRRAIIRPASDAERDRPLHFHFLHLIRRDGRGGLFLPCGDGAVGVSQHQTHQNSQKGSVA